MAKEISPKTIAVIVGILVVVLVGIGWKLFFTGPPTRTPEQSRKLLDYSIQGDTLSPSAQPTSRR